MPFEQKLRRIAACLGLFVAALGGIVLAGWVSNTDPLGFLRWNAAPMLPGAALCLIFAGASLWLQLQPGLVARRSGLVCAGLALAVVAAEFLQRKLNVDLGLVAFFSLLGLTADPARIRSEERRV